MCAMLNMSPAGSRPSESTRDGSMPGSMSAVK